MHYAPLTRDKSALYKTFLVDCGFLFPNAYISSSHLVSLGHTLLPNKCISLPILTYPCRTLQKVSHHNPHNPDLQIAFFFRWFLVRLIWCTFHQILHFVNFHCDFDMFGAALYFHFSAHRRKKISNCFDLWRKHCVLVCLFFPMCSLLYGCYQNI